MEPYLHLNGKVFVVSEEVTVTHHGLRVIDADDKRFITASNSIQLDEYRVETEDYEKNWLGKLKTLSKVPAHYVVRNETHTFVCGFDLLKNGGYWVGLGNDSRFDTMAEALAYLEAEIKEPFYLSLEEAMPV